MKAAHFPIALGLVCCMGVAHAAAPTEQTIPARRLVEVARAALPATASVAGIKITTRAIGVPPDAIVPAGAVDLRTEAPVGRWPRSRVAIPVEVWVNNKVVRTESIWFAVKAQRNGFVYAQDTPAGTAAAKLKMQSHEIDVADASGAPVESPDQLANERLKRGVHAGWPVLKSDFEAIPDVDRNARVIVHVRYGDIRLQAVATALQAGDVGDQVAVMVEGAQSPVQARVEAKGVVDIAR